MKRFQSKVTSNYKTYHRFHVKNPHNKPLHAKSNPSSSYRKLIRGNVSSTDKIIHDNKLTHYCIYRCTRPIHQSVIICEDSSKTGGANDDNNFIPLSSNKINIEQIKLVEDDYDDKDETEESDEEDDDEEEYSEASNADIDYYTNYSSYYDHTFIGNDEKDEPSKYVYSRTLSNKNYKISEQYYEQLTRTILSDHYPGNTDRNAPGKPFGNKSKLSKTKTEQIKLCILFWGERVTKNRRDRNYTHGIKDAETITKLLYLLLPPINYPDTGTDTDAIPNVINNNDSSYNNTLNKNSIHDDDSLLTTREFNIAITAWRFATFCSSSREERFFYLDSENFTQHQRRFKEVMEFQRWNASQTLYASEQAQKIFDIMEFLSNNRECDGGYFPSLRPTTYSYESVISCWSYASSALNIFMRTEGRAAGVLGYKPSTIEIQNDDEPFKSKVLLLKYNSIKPAKNADDVFEKMYSRAHNCENPDITMTEWAFEKTILSWSMIKVKPYRFSRNRDDSDETNLITDKDENNEYYIHERAEELLWKWASNSHLNMPQMNVFRSVISSWSHSNHPEGHLRAEAILHKMGEAYQSGLLEMMPSTDIFTAVLGSWARRCPIIPLEAAYRCDAILKHMELLALNSKSFENEIENAELNIQSEWGIIDHPDEKAYMTVLNAWWSAVRALDDANHCFEMTEEAYKLLNHIKSVFVSGYSKGEVKIQAYCYVLYCLAKSSRLISNQTSGVMSVLKEVGVDSYVGNDNLDNTEEKITKILEWTKELMKDIEQIHGSPYDVLDVTASTNKMSAYEPYTHKIIEAYTSAIEAFAVATSPQQTDNAYEANNILQKVIELHFAGHPSMIPSANMFSMVINAFLREGTVKGYNNADQILKQQEKLHYEGTPGVEPDSLTYRAMLGFCADNQSEVKSLLERMTKVYETNIVDDIFEPGTFSFNEIIDLWVKIGERQKAAEWAEAMLFQAEESTNKLIPLEREKVLTTKNCNAAIKAWLSTRNGQDRAERILESMESSPHLTPDHLSYHLIMKSYVNGKRQDHQIGTKVDSLMRRMKNHLKPSLVTYRLAIEGLCKGPGSTPQPMIRAEAILRDIEKMYQSKASFIRPNTRLFNIILQGWSRSSVPNKATRARELLSYMQEQYANGNIYAKPNLTSFHAVINACIHQSDHLSWEKRRKNYDVLLATFKDLAKSDYLAPRSLTYSNILKSCKILLPSGEEQQLNIKAIFSHCCRIGVVDDIVLEGFLFAAEPYLFKAVTGFEKEQLVTADDLPREWTRNTPSKDSN